MIESIQAGYIQFNPILGQKDQNISVMDSLINDGKEAQLLVLPELANSGYNFESLSQAFELAENLSRSTFLDFLIGKARHLNLFLVAGMIEEDNNKLYNTSVLVGPQGYLGKYRKIHLFWDEFDFFEKGNVELPVFDIEFARMGMLICFDWVFPEVWRILALKGAEVICHPSNLVLPYAQQAVPVHGLINKTYCITSNRFGTERGVTFSGESIISDPQGQILEKAPADTNHVAWTSLDLTKARDKKITPRNHVLDDRIPDLYKMLTNSE